MLVPIYQTTGHLVQKAVILMIKYHDPTTLTLSEFFSKTAKAKDKNSPCA
jgi:hypothetical protein